MIVTKELLYIIANNQLAQFKSLSIHSFVGSMCNDHDTCYKCELISDGGHCYATVVNKTLRRIRFEECYYARH